MPLSSLLKNLVVLVALLRATEMLKIFANLHEAFSKKMLPP